MCSKPLHRRAGFTLIEVLVALAIVSIALIALSQTGGRSIDTQFQLEQRTIALWVAANQLAEIDMNRPIQPGNRTGRLQMAGRDWRWQSQVQPAPGQELWRADVLIYNNSDDLVLTHSGFLGR